MWKVRAAQRATENSGLAHTSETDGTQPSTNKSLDQAIDSSNSKTKYAKTLLKFKEKQAERLIVPLDQITITRNAMLDGQEVEYDEKADDGDSHREPMVSVPRNVGSE